MPNPCRHCGSVVGGRKRNLCYDYHHNKAIRLRYPSEFPIGYRGPNDDHNGGYRIPAKPTAYLPGTPEKIEVLGQRRRQKVSLFHPKDARLGDAQPVRTFFALLDQQAA